VDLNTGRFQTFPAGGFIHADFDHRWAQHGTHHDLIEHDEHVMDMNEVRHRASERVQRRGRNVVCMIEEPDPPAGHLQIPFDEETTMFKTISAALLAVSVIAAPAFAAGQNKAAQAPVSKTATTKTVQTPAIKDANQTTKIGVKSGVLNANAKMGRHHHNYRHHRHHKKMGALKAHTKVSFKPVTKSHSKVSFKHTAPIAKRG
jgi:hypothetical protein